MHRVVITGYGMVSPLGLTAQSSWEALINGQSGVGPITLFDVSNFPVQYAAEVKGFDPNAYLDRREVRRQDRYQWLAQIAAQEAMEQSGLQITEENSSRIGVIISSGIGGLDSIEDQVTTLYNEGPRRVNPFGIPRIMTNGAAALVGIKYSIHGPSFSVGSACASASDGLGVAMNFIRSGVVDAAVTGGAESGITPLGIAAFHRIGAYSPRTSGTPSPFSADRDGLIMGEGAGILILESLEYARARGANIYAELIGYGASADAHHVTAPTEDGAGSAIAITRALTDAKVNPEDIKYINAHGTGTPLNDRAETLAIKLAFGEAAYKIPVSSSKSMTGHLMGATGALEAIFAIKAINDSIIPPTINYQERDTECDLDYVPNEARNAQVSLIASNAFGFGGHNSVLILSKFSS